MKMTGHLLHAISAILLVGCVPDQQAVLAPRRRMPKPAADLAPVSRERLTDSSRVVVETEPLSKSGPQVPVGFRTAAQASAGSGRYINPNQKHISGYTTRDGRQVADHIRTEANSTTQDNLRAP